MTQMVVIAATILCDHNLYQYRSHTSGVSRKNHSCEFAIVCVVGYSVFRGVWRIQPLTPMIALRQKFHTHLHMHIATYYSTFAT